MQRRTMLHGRTIAQWSDYYTNREKKLNFQSTTKSRLCLQHKTPDVCITGPLFVLIHLICIYWYAMISCIFFVASSIKSFYPTKLLLFSTFTVDIWTMLLLAFLTWTYLVYCQVVHKLNQPIHDNLFRVKATDFEFNHVVP